MSDMSDSGVERRGGVGFFGLLTIMFIGFKLAGIIDWDWWVVLSPMWGSFALLVVALIVLHVIDE